MKYEKCDPNKRYKSVRENAVYAPGVIPKYTTVQFRDGDCGTVLNSNQSRSLVEWGNKQDWFDNGDLRFGIAS